MGWLNRIFGGDNGGDRVNEIANRLYKAGRVSDLEGRLTAMRSDKLSPKELKSWYVLWTALAFRRGDRDVAFTRASEAIQALPGAPELNFAMGQEFEFRGNLEEMVRCFRLSKFPATSPRYALTATQYCYLHGLYDAALEFLNPLIEGHFELRIADDNSLFIRGMPFASTTFKTAVTLHLLRKTPSAARSLLQRAERDLTDHSLGDLGIYIDEYEQAKPALVVEHSPTFRGPGHSKGTPDGFNEMKFAVWKAKTLASVSEVEAIVRGVRLGKNDFPWLADVRTLSLSEACARFGEKEREQVLLKEFVASQGLLFEPEWALTFGFIDYQERVRTSVWPMLTGRDAGSR